MAVATIVTLIEEACGISADDDDLPVEEFATVGTLAEFVSRKPAV